MPDRSVRSLKTALQPLKDCGQCAPQPGEPYTPYTCYSVQQLLRIAHAWNARNPQQMVQPPANPSKRDIWEALKHAMSHMCASDEVCWARASGAYYSSPAHKVRVSFTEGITNDRLAKGMQQFLDVHPHASSRYTFMGVFPRDFNGTTAFGACVGKDMCSLTVESVLGAGKQGFCCVLNTDPHTKAGKHWVSFFCCFDPASPNFGAYYYDSNRVRSFKLDVSSRVRTFVKRLSKQAAQLGRPGFKLRVRSRVHQEEDGPCGLFALAFCMVCLLDLPVKDYMHSRHVNDDLMMEVMSALYLGKAPGGSRKPGS